MVTNIIETVNLTKKYTLKGEKKELTALDDVNISIREGEIFGLLGPNGAGKTTMIQILSTLRQPTSGYAIIDGIDIIKHPNQAKAKIALMLDSKMLYHRITAYDNLKFFCKIYKISNYKEKIYNVIKEFELEKWINQLVENFSSGMKMKLALCRTFLLERKILFLDEPTLGLDVKSVSFIIDKIKNSNQSIILTSHDMNVVEKLCDRIGFISQGKILKVGTKEDISKALKTEINIDIHVEENMNQLKSELSQQSFLNQIVDNKNFITVSLKKREFYKDLLSILSKYNILSVNERTTTLSELFMKII